MIKIKKLPAIFIILFLCTATLLSCKNEDNSERTPFSPESGEYTLMLKSGWQVISQQTNTDTLMILNADLGTQMGLLLTIDCYRKIDVVDINVSDIDSFINFYKTFEQVKDSYENENNTVGEAVGISDKDMKNTSVKSGKRQKISMTNIEGAENSDFTLEYIYLETEGHFFAVNYGIQNSDLTDEVKKAVDDAIFHIQENQE